MIVLCFLKPILLLILSEVTENETKWEISSFSTNWQTYLLRHKVTRQKGHIWIVFEVIHP